MIDYATFLALAEAEDIRVLNLLAQGHKLQFNVAEEAEAMQARIDRLDAAGFVVRDSRHRERRSDGLWIIFEALIEPAASIYVANAASERVQLSRDPLPTT